MLSSRSSVGPVRELSAMSMLTVRRRRMSVERSGAGKSDAVSVSRLRTKPSIWRSRSLNAAPSVMIVGGLIHRINRSASARSVASLENRR